MLRGFIFDLDGTLGDTLPVCYAAFRSTLAHFVGRTFTDREIAAMFGPCEEGILREWVPDRSDEAMEMFLREYERAHERCEAPFDGVATILARLAEAGRPLGIVTGKGAQTARISLARMGLEEWFADVEAGSPGGGIKPAAIRLILGRWGVEPTEAVYLGDTASDMRAAREVGMVAVGAAWAPGVDIAALEGERPDRVFRSVDELGAWIDRL